MLAFLITFEVTLLIMAVGDGNAQIQETTCCDDGAVRLADGALQNEGRVEMCVSGQWKTVCDDYWSTTEAQVVCRQLGYTNQGAIPRTHAAYGQGSGMIVEQVSCNGTERRLRDCAIRDDPDGHCSHYEDAGVQCSCRSGDVRLQGSSIQGRGRVEVCVNNVWGTVCHDSWSTQDANVVCGQLGFSRFGASARCCASYGRGSGPIHMTHVACVGNESALTDCIHTEQHNCHHGEDASVRCRTTIVCHDGDVRLVNGSQPHEGRVEMCFNETWGTVCDYIDPLYGWNTSEANVVCNKLGFSEACASTPRFGRGSLPVIAYSVNCRGFESSLAECTFSTSSRSTCYSWESIVGVVCKYDDPTRRSGKIRLTNGLTQFEGRVEIFWNSKWRAICSEGWDEQDAKVLCRQLNYLSTSENIDVISFEEHEFKTKGVPMLLTDVGCSGNESRLTECCSTNIFNNNHYHCHHTNGIGAYAGVRCAQCTENSVRLAGELSHSEGYVLICLGGSWGKVCRGEINETTVLCRQLGFSTHDPSFLIVLDRRYHYGEFIGLPHVMSSVQCNGTESRLVDCNYSIQHTMCYTYFEIKCEVTEEIVHVPGAPQNIKASNITLSSISLSWSPPPIADRHGLAISSYIINCSTNTYFIQENVIVSTDNQNATLSNLHPLTSYHCCVAGNSSRGIGKSACQRTFTLDENRYTSDYSPSRFAIKSTIINSTTTLLNWRTSVVPNNVCMTGVLLRYRVEIIEDITRAVTIYTTEDTHLLLTSLRPNHVYTVRVATLINNEIGSYSQLVTITTIEQSTDSTDQLRCHFSSERSSDQLPLISSLASFLGLVVVALVAAVSVAFYLYYKLSKVGKTPAATTRPRSEQIPGPVYEMVDLQVSTKGDCDGTELDSGSSPYTRNPTQAVQEYTTPITSNQRVISFDNKGGVAFQSRGVPTAEREDNTYQPLLPPRMATGPGNTEGDYQPLTRHTLPRVSNVSAPALPPKPKAK